MVNFIPGLKPDRSSGTARPYWFAFFNHRILVKIGADKFTIPLSSDFQDYQIPSPKKHYLGSLNGRHCYALELEARPPASETLILKGLRSIFGVIDEELIWVAGRANQIVTWSQAHQFCGKCGHATRDKTDERAKVCPQCESIYYPRISPAIIVAVVRDNRLLLARSPRFKAPFYSVLAGFVEPGETLEACVRREVYEEVGIEVTHIRYFGSQPWPFPDSLMIAFTAEYAGGEIRIDPSEIMEAGWFTAHNLPRVPPQISIARHLIDWFVHMQR